MSYTTIKAIWPGKKHENFAELSNGWGSGPRIWGALCDKYFNNPSTYLFDGTIDRLWPLWKDLSVPEHERAVLTLTYDRFYIIKKDFDRAAEDIEKFLKDFPVKGNHVDHLPKIMEIFKSDPDIPAIGLWCTSIAEDPFCGEWNEEKEEYDPLDWSMCYDLYASLDSIKDE